MAAFLFIIFYYVYRISECHIFTKPSGVVIPCERKIAPQNHLPNQQYGIIKHSNDNSLYMGVLMGKYIWEKWSIEGSRGIPFHYKRCLVSPGESSDLFPVRVWNPVLAVRISSFLENGFHTHRPRIITNHSQATTWEELPPSNKYPSTCYCCSARSIM